MATLIGFTGAGGVGKSSVLRRLVSLYGVKDIPSNTRQVFQGFGISNEEDYKSRDVEFKLEVQLALARSKAELDKQALEEARQQDIIATDRSPIDHFCYMLNTCQAAITESFLETYVVEMKAALKRFSVIYYFPLRTYFGSADGYRDQAYGPRYAVDALMRAALDKFRPGQYEPVYIDTIEDRTAFI